jgi:adenylate cyclase
MPDRFRQSPLFHMIESQIPFLRRRLTGDEALLDFPILEEFREQGITDYLGFMVGFSDDPHDGIVGSWATDRASGFSERDIQTLRRIQRRLGVAFKVHIREQIARNVLTTYLGPKTGRRVLDGQIERGDGETIHAAIWYSDLRNSTRLAANLTPTCSTVISSARRARFWTRAARSCC